MGPRPISRGEETVESDRKEPTAELQWGRGRSAAESGKLGIHYFAATRFNGAAADQPRRGGDAAEDHSYRTGFNGAAADQPRRACFPGVSTAQAARFNGAAADQPRRGLQITLT